MWGGLILSTHRIWASADLDRQYALETVGLLKSWDNVDGLFTEYIAAAYKDYFSKPTRFAVNDLSLAESLFLHSKLSYQKIIKDSDILGQLARMTHTETLIRTEVTQEGTQYFFTLDWLHGPQMEIISTIRFSLEEPAEGAPLGTDLISLPIQANLEKLFAQVPFMAQVTGRDNRSVTVSFGSQQKVREGDVLVVATLDEVKKHPLLKSIVGWKLTPVGKLIVEQISDGMAFCKILEEEPGREIARYQKVIQIQGGSSLGTQGVEQSTHEPQSLVSSTPPQLGWISVSLPTGSYTRQVNSPASLATLSGGGFILGGKAEGQIWLTQSWFADLGFGYSFWNFTQQNSSGIQTAISQTGGVAGSALMLKADLGYSYLIDGDFLGPKGWVKLGYQSNSYSLPTSTAELTGPLSLSSLYIGIGGDLPIRGKWGVQANFNYRILTGVSQSWLNETTLSASDIGLFLGVYYRLNERVSFGCGFEVNAADAGFSAGSNISQKTMTFLPQLLYYF